MNSSESITRIPSSLACFAFFPPLSPSTTIVVDLLIVLGVALAPRSLTMLWAFARYISGRAPVNTIAIPSNGNKLLPSCKNTKQARELGIRVIDSDEFMEMIKDWVKDIYLISRFLTMVTDIDQLHDTGVFSCACRTTAHGQPAEKEMHNVPCVNTSMHIIRRMTQIRNLLPSSNKA